MIWSVENISELVNKMINVGNLTIDLIIPRYNVINEILLDYHTINTIQQATRVTQKMSPLIDWILIANDSNMLDWGTIEVENNVSDHKGTYIYIEIIISLHRAYRRKLWIDKSADFEKLNTLIEILIRIQ